MRVLSIPRRLRTAALVLSACVPLAAFEVVLVSRTPWWKLPYELMGAWSLAVALLCLPLAVWVLQGRKWALRLAAALATAWCLVSFVAAFRLKNPTLGFFALGLIVYWLVLLSWLRHELSRSFFDPRMRWYQGLPEIIPGLKCQLALPEDRRAELKVSRLDSDGAFVVAESSSGFFGLHPSEEAEMIFMFREKQVRCSGRPVRALETGDGRVMAAGFQFTSSGERAMSADARKELGDFVETLRGEGHV
jgi:hypothetical protein